MRTLFMLANAVCQNVGQSAADGYGGPTPYAQQKVYRWLNDRYRQLYHLHLWPKTLVNETVDVAVSATSITLPKHLASVLRIVNDTTGEIWLSVDAASYSDKVYGNTFLNRTLNPETVGTPVVTRIGSSNVLRQPAAAGVITVVSSSTADAATKIIQVYVRGRDANGETIGEAVVLGGTTPVNTTAAYSNVDALSKTATTTGTVTVKDTGANVLATIAPWEASPLYEQFKIEMSPTQPTTLIVTAQRRFTPFLDSADVAVMEMDDALIAGATVDAFGDEKIVDKAGLLHLARWEKEYQHQVEALVHSEIETGSNIQLAVPMARA